jgi:Na+/H+-dicarboxylate symporter
MKATNKKIVKIGKLALSEPQFIVVCAIGGALAAIPGLLAPRAQPWPCSSFFQILMSRQLLNTLMLGLVLSVVFIGVASFKHQNEMRRIERAVLLFWAAYAGSSMGPLLGTH